MRIVRPVASSGRPPLLMVGVDGSPDARAAVHAVGVGECERDRMALFSTTGRRSLDTAASPGKTAVELDLDREAQEGTDQDNDREREDVREDRHASNGADDVRCDQQLEPEEDAAAERAPVGA